LYTLRPNSTGDAGGQIYMTMASGIGTIAGGEVFTITYSKPIVGAAGIGHLPQATAAAEFCDDTAAGNLMGVFCSSMSYSAAGNVLTLTNGPTPLSGLAAPNYITIWGVRFNTVGVPPGTFITATVGAVLNQNYPISFGMAGVTQTQTPVNVGQVATTAAGGTVLEAMNPDSPYYNFTTSILTCYGANSTEFQISVSEQWAGAWTSLSDEMMLAPYAPTASKSPTNGSDISVTISGIPQGVTVTPVGLPVDVLGTATWGTNSTLGPYTGAVANDSYTFDFPLTSTVRDEIESANFTFAVSTNGPIALQSAPMVASVTLNPMTPTAPVQYPAFTYPNGPLATEPTPQTVVVFFGCQTNLLFPYVTNYTGSGTLGNWDTGIVVSNTSSDPYGPPSVNAEGVLYSPGFGAIPTAGTCAFSVYASNSGTLTPTVDATPVATFNTAPVYTGGVDAFMLSQTSAKGVGGAYAIAVCNFLNGTGYAQVVDNANGLGNWGVMGSYLAYVIPTPFEEPRWLDSIFGEFAISPWAYYYSSPFSHKGSSRSTPRLRAPSAHK
jgi:hypothetical protein